jgi:kinesin family protein 2/24
VQWVGGGGMSMLLAYGQTGSGKTFTVSGMEKLVVEKLMDGKVSGKWDVHMCIFEVAGSNMCGMLNKCHPAAMYYFPLTDSSN